MPVTLPPPIYYDALAKLEAEDENVILAALYARDQALYNALVTILQTNQDLYTQFNLVQDLTSRIIGLNQTINGILAAFNINLGLGGTPTDQYAGFAQLIAELKANIGYAETLSAGIIQLANIQAALVPVTTVLNQLDDLDLLIQVKLDYIYGKFNVDPADDILLV